MCKSFGFGEYSRVCRLVTRIWDDLRNINGRVQGSRFRSPTRLLPVPGFPRHPALQTTKLWEEPRKKKTVPEPLSTAIFLTLPFPRSFPKPGPPSPRIPVWTPPHPFPGDRCPPLPPSVVAALPVVGQNGQILEGGSFFVEKHTKQLSPFQDQWFHGSAQVWRRDRTRRVVRTGPDRAEIWWACALGG